MYETKLELMREFVRRAGDLGLETHVPMDGAFNSEIAIVAEAPGETEKATRIPLSGSSGKYLWDVLRKYGITRQSVYITNVIKRQVSLSSKKGGNEARLECSPHELAAWEGLLQWELSQLPNLKYVVILGDYALSAICGESGIMSWRGSVFPVTIGRVGGVRRTVTVICAVNPVMVLREPKHDITFRHDMHKLKRVLADDYPPHEIEHIINPSFDEAMAWLDKMQDENMPVSYDIETIAGETACIGFANDPHVGMCIAFRGLKHNVYSREDELRIRRRVQTLVGDPAVRLVAQNGNFDAYWLWYKDRVQVYRNWFDTLLAHHTLYSTLPHNLGFLTAQYTTHPYYKDDKQGWKEGGDIDRFWRYNVKDVCITLECQRKLIEELRDAQQDKFFFDHVMRLQPHLTRMTVMGIPIDMELKTHIAETMQADVDALKQRFYQEARAATGEDDNYCPNPASWKQLGDLFFRRLKLVGRGTSTDKDNRVRMIEHPRTPPLARVMLRTCNQFAEEAKFAGTYAEMETDDDGRARTEYKQYGTQSAPGRLSSTQVMWGTGGNFQNQPQRAQPMFVAPEGYGFGYFDLAQAEARYVGWDAEIETWIEQFERARIDGVFDCHRALAADMFGVPYDQVPTFDHVDISRGKIVEGLEDHAPTQRYIAKRCRHGLNYRMNWPRLADTANLSLRDAERAYNVYHRLTPQLREWWDKLTVEVTKDKMLFNAYGRRLVIIERITDEALESIVAFKPQSTIGDKVSRVIYLSEDDDEWPMYARIVLNIHDALVCVAPLAQVKTCLRIMKKYAEEPLYIHGRELIIPADLKQSIPIAWEMDEKTHVLRYQQNQGTTHRWYGMEKVVL